MVHYKPVKITIDAPGLIKVIIDIVVRHRGVSELIITDRGLLFTSKFWSLLCYFLGIKKSYLLLSTLKQTARPRDKIARWKPTSEYSSIGSKTTGQGCCQWRNLPITMPRMPALVTLRSNSTAATTPESLSKKMLTPAQDLVQLTSEPKSWKNWWKFAVRTFSTYRSCRRKPMTRE